MASPTSLTGVLILQALAEGYKFGFDVMSVTGLPSGTIYPALRRLEWLGLVTSDWEQEVDARKSGRPKRRYYKLTQDGRRQLKESEARIRALGRLLPRREMP